MLDVLIEKEKKLRFSINKLKSVIVGYSGGIDSSLVAKIATEELGKEALIVISKSPSLPQSELNLALDLAQTHHFNYRIIETQEAEDQNYLENPVNRCFYCKTELYTFLERIREKEAFQFILDGANLDDVGDYRPGRKAASDNKVISPLMESKMTKTDVRQLAKKVGLENFNKPAAACLSSRFPYGTSISIKKLSQVEKAEDFLKTLGLVELRVRYHNDVARIEVGSNEFEIVLENKEKIYSFFQTLGFTYTALDLLGFRSGALNESLDHKSSNA